MCVCFRRIVVVATSCLDQSCIRINWIGSGSSISSASGSGYGSNLDPGFWWPKTGNKYTTHFLFFIKKMYVTYVQATEEAFSPQRRTSSTSKKLNLLTSFYVCGSFVPWWIRIRIKGPHWIRTQSGSGSTSLVQTKYYRQIFRNSFYLLIMMELLITRPFIKCFWCAGGAEEPGCGAGNPHQLWLAPTSGREPFPLLLLSPNLYW